MNIQLEKQALIKMIEETNDFSIIESIKVFFKTKEKDFWDELSDEQKAEINRGIEDFDKGRIHSYEEVMKYYL